MSIDRNKFKGSTLNSIKDEQGRAEKALPALNSGSNRAGFHTIEDGKNFRRIAPPHNEGEPAYRAKSTVFLECEVNEFDDDGNQTGKKELKKKNIFIATQHSLSMKADPVLTYIDFVNRLALDTITDKDKRQSFLYPINGWRGKDGKWNWGLKPDIKYVCYAWDDKGKLGREELYPKMLDDMKKISISQNSDDAEIVPDIFTDPDEGYPLIITKQKNEKSGKTEYIINCEMPNKKETWIEFFERHRLTDEQLIELTSKESLKELYEDSYTTRDFEMAVDGLVRFDTIHKYGIFQNEEFLDALEEMRADCPVYQPKEEESKDEPRTDKPAPKTNTTAPSTPKPEPKVEPKAEEKVTPPTEQVTGVVVGTLKMKKVIEAYIAENYSDEGYTMPALSKEQIVEWYDLCQAGEELPWDEFSNSTSAPVEDKEPVKIIEKGQSMANFSGMVKKDDKPEASEKQPVQTTSNIDADVQAQINRLRSRTRK